MVALPAEIATTRPAFDIVATPTGFEVQVEAVAEPLNWLVASMHKEEFPVTVGSALTVTCKVAVQELLLV